MKEKVLKFTINTWFDSIAFTSKAHYSMFCHKRTCDNDSEILLGNMLYNCINTIITVVGQPDGHFVCELTLKKKGLHCDWPEDVFFMD